MYRLFAYPDSSDLYELEQALVDEFGRFARSWRVEGVLLTNAKAPLMEGQELPDWNIGLRVETDRLSRENIDELLSFTLKLSRKLNLPFVLGTWTRRSVVRDLCRIDGQIPDGAVGIIMEGAHAA